MVGEPRHGLPKNALRFLELANVPQGAAQPEQRAEEVVVVEAGLDRRAVLRNRLGFPPRCVVREGPFERLAAQNSSSFATASTTRSTDGMYASSICQYGYGTS